MNNVKLILINPLKVENQYDGDLLLATQGSMTIDDSITAIRVGVGIKNTIRLRFTINLFVQNLNIIYFLKVYFQQYTKASLHIITI